MFVCMKMVDIAGSSECIAWKPAKLSICEKWVGQQHPNTKGRVLWFHQRKFPAMDSGLPAQLLSRTMICIFNRIYERRTCNLHPLESMTPSFFLISATPCFYYHLCSWWRLLYCTFSISFPLLINYVPLACSIFSKFFEGCVQGCINKY